MTADDLLQDVAAQIYTPPLSGVRERSDFPNLENTLHLAILLIDCDTEIAMNGILGFLENLTGAHLESTITALIRIGAPHAAAKLTAVRDVMRKHDVTWKKLRGDFDGASDFQITSFRKLHGRDEFVKDVPRVAPLFAATPEEDAYQKLCEYLDQRIDALSFEIEQAKKA